MAYILKAPKPTPASIAFKPSIFLAGSIDMGSAVDWQTRVEQELANYDVVIYNPRRDDWDSSWVQDISNRPFREQVEWELTHLEECDLILVYFDPHGAAPITLLELGLFGIPENERIIVCCPNGYWRKGNVDIVCERYGIKQVPTLDDLIQCAHEWCDERTEIIR